jgi:Spy/CpxP family protein refolding chaperone
MKKQIAAVALVLTLAVAGIASARGGMGGGGMMGGGMNCPQMQGQMAMPQLDKATQDKLDAFQRDTQTLRKQIVMKHAEMRALMQAETPNPATVSKLSGELFDLQAAIQDKARAAGVENLVGGPCGMGCGMMGGRGPGHGMMMGGGRM